MFDDPILKSAFLRDHLAEVLDHLHYREKRYLITRRGKAVAALVMPHDLARIEEFERTTVEAKRKEQARLLEAFEQAKRIDREMDGLY